MMFAYSEEPVLMHRLFKILKMKGLTLWNS